MDNFKGASGTGKLTLPGAKGGTDKLTPPDAKKDHNGTGPLSEDALKHLGAVAMPSLDEIEIPKP